MIILDTHVWVWNVQGDKRLSKDQQELIRSHESKEIGISAISLWEVAKAVELKRLTLSRPVSEWLVFALDAPGIILLPLTADIAVESTQLPGKFHKDPFDQLIVATARIYDAPLVTSDSEILSYPHVKLLPG
ncbi:MAG: type II toxin-antitoxin system VapC family toxin [Pyrinomonadaceae bacterium]|mgnify:CR=1 FL=1